MENELFEAALTRSVIGAFFEVHSYLGFGFLEHIYVQGLVRELRARGHSVAQQMSVDVHYKGEVLGTQRLDLVVDGKLVLEVKSTQKLDPIAERQLMNYLRATEFELGLLLHFGEKAKFYRKILQNKFKPDLSPRRLLPADPTPDNEPKSSEKQDR